MLGWHKNVQYIAFSLQKLSMCVCGCLYSHSMGFFELADLLNLIHEISSVYVLHDKIQTVLLRDGGADREREVKKYMLIKSRPEVTEKQDDSEKKRV